MRLDKAKLDLLANEIKSCGLWAKEKQNDLHVSIKEDKTPVTEVDITISKRIIALIKELFPECGIISEEEKTELINDVPFTFVLDPIDGTDSYSQGLPSFAIALAILDKQNLPLGAIIYAPRFGKSTDDGLFLRLDPDGKITLNGKELQIVGDKKELKQITISSTFTQYVDSSQYKGKLRIFGSSIIHLLAPIVFPQIQACVATPCYIWDYAASHALLLATGMDIYNEDGTPFRYSYSFLNRNKSIGVKYAGYKETVDKLRREIFSNKEQITN